MAASHLPKNEVEAALPLVHAGLPEIAPQDIERLNRCFSIKTMLNVKLGCGEEAKQLLEASRTDPVIQHAIESLRALREDLDATGYGKTAITQQAPSYGYGLKQYNMALGGLVSDMSFQSSNRLKSALLCCQIFISIEQLLGNYDAMSQHIIRGLMIMHESRARPALDDNKELLPACRDQLPLLDVFIVKLFAAPCNFADAPKTGAPATSVESPSHRTLAPDTRRDLTRISESLLEFLDEVSQVQTTECALQLEPKRSALLHSLEAWQINLETSQPETGVSELEPISSSFQRLFYHIMQIVLLGTLDSSPECRLQLLTENDNMQSLANVVGQRVRDYRMG